MRITPVGYSHLGIKQTDGIRYVWQLAEKQPYIESAAFTTRAKIPTAEMDQHISAYTTSVSSGCALTAARVPCKFCRTGNTLRFSGPLTAQEIAMQNVLMVLSDMENKERAACVGNLREFAYMGQGEPGFSYTQLRQAIKITDMAMAKLGQKVFRHIVATCGVTEMVDSLMDDLNNKFYGDTRITFHFSLHATQHRDEVMPVNSLYDYRQITSKLGKVFEATSEKPCVGILMFKNYHHGDPAKACSTDAAEMDRVIALLDPAVCRISLCEFNQCGNVGENGEVTPEEADGLVKQLENKGFQVKLFASFGKQENAACGLLGGTEPDVKADGIIQERYERALSLIQSLYQ